MHSPGNPSSPILQPNLMLQPNLILLYELSCYGVNVSRGSLRGRRPGSTVRDEAEDQAAIRRLNDVQREPIDEVRLDARERFLQGEFG